MGHDDARELAWWREFAIKFMPGDIPSINTPMLGYRLVVCVNSDGGLTPWSQR